MVSFIVNTDHHSIDLIIDSCFATSIKIYCLHNDDLLLSGCHAGKRVRVSLVSIVLSMIASSTFALKLVSIPMSEWMSEIIHSAILNITTQVPLYDATCYIINLVFRMCFKWAPLTSMMSSKLKLDRRLNHLTINVGDRILNLPTWHFGYLMIPEWRFLSDEGLNWVWLAF